MTASTAALVPEDSPRDAIEELIADLWRDALGVEHVGVNDHFYALGGDSLLAAVVACGISDLVGVEVSPRLTLKHCELGRLAEAVRRTLRCASSDTAAVRRGGDRHLAGSPPCGGRELPPTDPRGNVMAVLQMEPLAFHQRAAEQAVRSLCERHALQPARGLQSRAGSGSPGSPPIARIVDLRFHPQIERRRGHVFHRTAAAEALVPFHSGGRVLRVSVLLLPEETWTFLLISHRSVCDATSLGVLCHELGALYAAACGAAAGALVELPENYAELVRPYLKPGRRPEAAPAAPGSNGAARSNGAAPHPTHTGSSCSFLLETGLTDVLHRLALEEETTLFTLVSAAYMALLAEWSGRPDVAFGCYPLNRPGSELHGLVGPFASLTVLRADVAGEPDFRGLMRRVGAEALASLEYPTREQGVRDPAGGAAAGEPPFLPILEFRGPSHPLGSLDRLVDTGLAPHPLLLFAAESGGRLCFTFEYDRSRFSHEEIAQLGGRLKLLLRNVCENPDVPISRLSEERGGATRAIRMWREDLQSHSLKFLHRAAPDEDAASVQRAREPVDDGPVTVLTAVHARSSRRLKRFLRALRAQRYAGTVEIVVCDDASPCPAVLEQACAEYGARYVRATRSPELADAMHKCRALNAGVEAATGRYLFYLDGDILLTPHHIQNCVNLARYHGETIACTNRRCELVNLLAWDDWSPSGRFHLTLDRVLELLGAVATCEPVPSPNLGWDWRHVFGNNLFLSRALAERVGPWDEAYVGYGEEDIDYAIRIHRSGGVFARTLGLPVYHIGHPRQENDERQAALWAQNAIRFFEKFPDTVPLRSELYEKIQEHFGGRWPGAAASDVRVPATPAA